MLKKQLFKTCLILFVVIFYSSHLLGQNTYCQYDHWITNGEVMSFAEDANFVYAGGNFTYTGPPTGSAAKISTTNPTPDLSFCRPNGTVYSIISDGVGGWFIGGDFTRITTSFSTSVIRNNIAHVFSNGQLDLVWNPNASNPVWAMVLSGTDLFVGGDFGSIGAQSRNRIAKLTTTGTGTADATWNPNADNYIRALALNGTELFVGGAFTNIGGISRSRIAKLNTIGTGTANVTWNPISNGPVWSLLLVGTELYVGGSFSNIGAQNRNNIAKLSTTGSGNANATWNPNATGGIVHSMLVINTELYVGGLYNNIGGQPRSCLAKITTTGTGSADINWDPNPNYSVKCLAYSGTDLYVGGQFTNIGAQNRNFIARVSINGVGAVDATYNSGACNAVNSIAISNSDVYLGGSFISVGGATKKYITRFDKTNGAADQTWNPNANNVVQTLAIAGAEVFVGGVFTNIGGQNRNSIAKLATTGIGNADALWNPNCNGNVTCLTVSGNDLYVGGAFSTIGSLTKFNIARLSTLGLGAADATWDPSTDNLVRVMLLSGTDLFLGGDFTQIGTQTKLYLAKLSTVGTGTADATWNPNPNLPVWALTFLGSDLFVGGGFSTIGGQNRMRIAKLSMSGTGSADVFWNPSADQFWVKALALSGSDLYAGGDFLTIGGQTRNKIAKLSLTGSGLADPIWNPNSNNEVTSLLFSSTSKLYFGGLFSDVGSLYSRTGLCVINECSFPAPPINSTPVSNQTICANSSTTLNAVGSGTINWFTTPSSTNIVGTGTSIVTPTLGTGTYTYFAEASTCGPSINRTPVTFTVISCTSVGVEEIVNEIRPKVYPNPSNGAYRIDLKENSCITVYNNLGQMIYQEKFNAGSIQININQFPNGLYLLKCKTGNYDEAFRIIKE